MSSLHFMRPATAAAATLTVAGAALALGVPHTARDALTLALIALDAAVATAVTYVAERRTPPRTREALAAQGALAAAILALSGGRAFLVAMPFVSMCVLYLRLRAAVVLAGAVVVFTAWQYQRAHGAAVMLGAFTGLAASVTFVFAFSLVMRRERDARAENERLVDELRRANAQIDEAATTKERNRIAREVHDGLGHTLTVASVQLEAARAHLGDGAARERVERAQQMLREGLGELRRSVSLLRASPTNPQAFARAIAELVAESSAAGLEARLEIAGEPRVLRGEVGFALYRATQEALTNARRHARAQHAALRLCYAPEAVELRVADDGEGADEFAPGNGLAGLRERLDLVGGTLAVETRARHGFTLVVRVPE